MLFEEQTQGHLFGGSVKRVKGRMSFFKRLSWQKGSPVAMWEDVLVAVRDSNMGVCAITSPPYFESGADPSGDPTAGIRGRVYARQQFGDTPGQIGNLPDKAIRMCAITSPPYIDTDVDGARKMPPGYFDQVGGIGHTKTIEADSPGQIGRLRDKT